MPESSVRNSPLLSKAILMEVLPASGGFRTMHPCTFFCGIQNHPVKKGSICRLNDGFFLRSNGKMAIIFKRPNVMRLFISLFLTLAILTAFSKVQNNDF